MAGQNFTSDNLMVSIADFGEGQTGHIVHSELLRSSLGQCACRVDGDGGSLMFDLYGSGLQIQAEQLGGAALDVLTKEPPDPENPLLHMDNVVITPHYGAASAEAIVEQEREIGQSAAALIQGQWPPYVVNRDVVPKKPLSRSEIDRD